MALFNFKYEVGDLVSWFSNNVNHTGNIIQRTRSPEKITYRVYDSFYKKDYTVVEKDLRRVK